MKKMLVPCIFFCYFLAGCSTNATDYKKELHTKQKQIESQAEQIKNHEDTIEAQEKTIEGLTSTIAELEKVAKENQVTINEEHIIVFRGDSTASFIYPTTIPYKKETDLVEAIHEYVSEYYGIGLNSYTFKDDGKLLILDYDDNAKKVQGSTGTSIFLRSMTESYFANFHELLGIKLLLNGDGNVEVIGESGSNEIFIREGYTYEPIAE